MTGIVLDTLSTILSQFLGRFLYKMGLSHFFIYILLTPNGTFHLSQGHPIFFMNAYPVENLIGNPRLTLTSALIIIKRIIHVAYILNTGD